MAVRTISQEAFDDLVRENLEELGMDPPEALQDAIETLTLQGVDLSGIVTCVPGQFSANDHPVMRLLDKIKHFESNFNCDARDLEELAASLHQLSNLCSADNSENANIAAKNRGVELVTSVFSKVSPCGNNQVTVSALKALASLLYDVQCAETFQKSGGPYIIMDVLNGDRQNLEILDGCFSVIGAAATRNEVLKESFMNLKIEQSIIRIMRRHSAGSIPSLYDAIRILLTSDDNRVVASQVYGYARKFAEIGVAEALVDSLSEALSSPSVVSASVALKAVAVNDEICRVVAGKGGIDAILRCIDGSGECGNKVVARSCCSLLSKLAGSDVNKSAIVEKGGIGRVIKISKIFSDDASVLQEVMYLISVLSLRSPDHAARAVEAGAGDLANQAMQKFPTAQQLQRNACLMIRNLAVRNPENRTILLSSGIETAIRKAKEVHGSCKDPATDALRDLGLNNYNS
ncbi:hypothetical protein Nepgr_018067 [Nepenthes gracilis]|uniref:Armadillo repeat-containing protein 6 n=1 Tax=Nepenthes gracilis TaxID=150966 RepID=A0AAD3ST45_NEPGR|nr:hypothetical protein Nepgr_018067 [Nepenthes gracilis]